MRRACRFLACVSAALALSACTKTGGVSQTGTAGGTSQGAHTIPHVLRFADTLNVTSLNPHFYTSASLVNLSQLTMAYLARYDEHNGPIPELATEIPSQANGGISKDGKTITWHLRRDAKWSDGVAFDADDVVFSTQAVINPRNNEVGRDGWNLIAKIDEPDKYTVVYHLKEPFASFLPNFFGTAGANPCLLPKHILGNLPDINTAPYNSLPVGIGPFRYVSWKRSDSIQLEPNPYYFRGKPKLEKIIFKIIPDRNTLVTQLQTGEVDLWPEAGQGYLQRLKSIPGLTVINQPSYFYAHLDFNLARPLLGDVRVRRALRYATDRSTIIEKAFHGLGIRQESMISPANPAYRPFPEIPYDPAKANALLDDAGWTQRAADGIRMKNGRRLSLEYSLYTGAADIDTMVELIRANWKAVGVEIQLRHYETSLFFALAQNGGIVYGGKFDVTSFSWGGSPNGDISEQYGCAFIPPNGQNMPRWCNKRFDADMANFKVLYGAKERQPYLDDAIQRILDEVPTFVTYINNDIYAYNSDLHGFHPNAVTPFDDFMNVDI